MPKFHTLKVREIRRETPECVSVAFEVPAELKEDFAFVQGQNLTLKTTINGEEIRRSYSICTSPAENDLRVAVKKVSGGRFSTFANERLQVGDELDVMTPTGSFFTPLDPAKEKYYLAFAAGSGITPIMSILKTVLAAEPDSSFTLFYGNKTLESIIFREELAALKNCYLGRLSIHYILSREHIGTKLFEGRITADKCRDFCEILVDVDQVDEYFLCGPEPMIRAVKETLLARGADPRKIHFELFTTPGTVFAGAGKATRTQKASEAVVSVTLDGLTTEFSMPASTDSLLDAATQSGLDLPFACKGGVCCSCRARLLEGKVEMDVNYALEPHELEAGYILCCQSHPVTERIVIDFDS